MSAPVLWACPCCGAETVPGGSGRLCSRGCRYHTPSGAGGPWGAWRWFRGPAHVEQESAREACTLHRADTVAQAATLTPIVIPPDTHPASRCPSCGTPAERTREGEPVCDHRDCNYRGWAHRYARAPKPAGAVADPLAGVAARLGARLVELQRIPWQQRMPFAVDMSATLAPHPKDRKLACLHGDAARRNTACPCERAMVRP